MEETSELNSPLATTGTKAEKESSYPNQIKTTNDLDERNTLFSFAKEAIKYREQILTILTKPITLYFEALGLTPSLFYDVSAKSVADRFVKLADKVSAMLNKEGQENTQTSSSTFFEIKNPWQGDLITLPNNAAVDEPKGQAYLKQLEVDFLAIYMEQRLIILILSGLILYKLTSFECYEFITAFQAILQIGLAVGTINLIKQKKVMLALNLFQSTMIIITWQVIARECMVDQEAQSDWGTQILMHGFTDFFLNPYCLLNRKALQHFKIQPTSLLIHIQLLLFVLLMTRMPSLYAVAIVCHILMIVIRSYLKQQTVDKLLLKQQQVVQQDVVLKPKQTTEETQTIQQQKDEVVAKINNGGIDDAIECFQQSIEQMKRQLPSSTQFDTLRQNLQMKVENCNFLKLFQNNASHELVAYSFEKILRQTIEFYQPKLELQRKYITIYKDKLQQFPQQTMLNVALTTQLLFNLIQNQISYRHSTEITIEILWIPEFQSVPPNNTTYQHKAEWMTSTSLKGHLNEPNQSEYTISDQQNASFISQEESKIDLAPLQDSMLYQRSNADPNLPEPNSFSSSAKSEKLGLLSDQTPQFYHQSNQPHCLDESQVEQIDVPRMPYQPQLHVMKPNLEDVVIAQKLEQIKENEESEEIESQFSIENCEEISILDQQRLDMIVRTVVPATKAETLNFNVLQRGAKSNDIDLNSESNLPNAQSVVESDLNNHPAIKLGSIASASDNKLYESCENNQILQAYQISGSEIEKNNSQNIMVNSSDIIQNNGSHKSAESELIKYVYTIPEEEKKQDSEVYDISNIINAAIHAPVLPQQQPIIVQPQPGVDLRQPSQFIEVGETGSGCFQQSRSMSPRSVEVEDFPNQNPQPQFQGASEISMVRDSARPDQAQNNAEYSMVSLLDELGTNQSANQSMVNDQPGSERKKVQQNSDQQKGQSLFGAYNIVKAQDQSSSLKHSSGNLPQEVADRRRSSSKKLMPPPKQNQPNGQWMSPQKDNNAMIFPPQFQQESEVDALKRFQVDALQGSILKYKQRRQSVCVAMNSKDSMYTPKTIKVRHPMRARSKSILLPNFSNRESKNFPISRLNNYDNHLKKHRGSIVSMQSSLQSIDEDHDLEDCESPKLPQKNMSAFERQKAELRKSLQSQVIKSKNNIQIKPNSIVHNVDNFGHGRRNNLVKIADLLVQKNRAFSVIITDKETHLRKLQAQAQQAATVQSDQSVNNGCNKLSVFSSVHDSVKQLQTKQSDQSNKQTPNNTQQKQEPSSSMVQPNQLLAELGSHSLNSRSRSSKSKKRVDSFEGGSLSKSNSNSQEDSNKPKSLFKQEYSIKKESKKALKDQQLPPQGKLSDIFPPKPNSLTQEISFLASKQPSVSMESNGILMMNQILVKDQQEGFENGTLFIRVVDETYHEGSTQALYENLQNQYKTTAQLCKSMNGQLRIQQVQLGTTNITVTIPTKAHMGVTSTKTLIPLKQQEALKQQCDLEKVKQNFNKIQVMLSLTDSNLTKEITQLFVKCKTFKVNIQLYSPDMNIESDTFYFAVHDQSSQHSVETIINDKKQGQLVIVSIGDKKYLPGLSDIDFFIEKENLREELSEIVNKICGEQQSLPSINIQEKDPSFEDNIKSPYIDRLMRKTPLSNNKLISEISKKQEILAQVNAVSQTQHRYTQYDKVSKNGSVILVIDYNQEVRDQIQTQFIKQINQTLITYVSKRVESPYFDQIEEKVKKKISKPSLFLIEAISGEQGVKIFEQLLSQGSNVHMILIRSKLTSNDHQLDSKETAHQMKVLEQRHNEVRSNQKSTVLTVGYCVHIEEFYDIIDSTIFDVYREKPFDEQLYSKMVNIVLGKNSKQMSKRDKLLQVFKHLK